MKPDTQSHLSQEAFDDVLIGIGSRASRTHLAQCEECRARVDAFQSAIHDFNAATLAYSESQPIRVVAPLKPAHRFGPRPVFAAWAAAALLILSGPTVWRQFHSTPVQAPATVTVAGDRENQIAEDNSLMQQVDAAIAPDEQSVVDQYQLLEDSGMQEPMNMRTE